MPIHRHRTSSESMAILRGKMIMRFYDDNGNLTDETLMEPSWDCPMVQVEKGQWHSLEVLEEGTVVFEAKDGRYEPFVEKYVAKCFWWCLIDKYRAYMGRIINALMRRANSLIFRLGGGKNRISGLTLFQRFTNLTISGKNNTIEVKSKLSKGVKIVVFGNNHHLVIGKNVTFKRGRIWFEDEGCTIRIGEGTTIENASLSAAEIGTSLEIGEDCMLSADVRISTTDAHSIIDLESGKRTNPAQDIKIGNHVWIGRRVSVGKGVAIGDNSVIARNSVVTKNVQNNSIVAGVPAKQVKENITWMRERI